MSGAMSDQERRRLATLLGASLRLDASPYSAPDRITVTSRLLCGDYRGALDLLGLRPGGGVAPSDTSTQAWWDFAAEIADRMEDAAEVTP